MPPVSSSIQARKWTDLPVWFIQIGLLSLVALRLDSTGWTTGLGMIVNLVFYGFALGTLAGVAHIRRRYCISIGLLYGILAVGFLLGQVYLPELEWPNKIPILTSRLHTSIGALQLGARLDDPILFYSFAASIVWLLAYASACQFSWNGGIWINLTGSAILFQIIDRYDIQAEHRTIFFLAWMGLSLLLAARSTLVTQQRKWEENRSFREENLSQDLTRISWLVIISLLIVVWVIPIAISPQGPVVRLWKSLANPMDDIRNQAANLFAPLESRSRQTEFSSRYLALGLEANQESTPVLRIEANQPPGENNRFYWRARTYDTYQDGYWSNAKAESFPYEPQIDLVLQQFTLQRERFDISVLVQADQISDLYTEQQPAEISTAGRVHGNPLPDGQIDLQRFQAELPLERGSRYQFSSYKSVASIEMLSLVRSEAPEWVQNTYLQIPTGLQQPLQALAQEITGQTSVPYEKTILITRYLRNNYLYQPRIDPAPGSTDPVLHFLLESKKGFCTYFASAEVLLLRAAGVPARLVVGFNQGEPDKSGRMYQVRMKDLHTWPEVFLGEYGWVAMEPTTLYEPVMLPALNNQSEEERQELLDRRSRDRSTVQPDVPNDLPDPAEDSPANRSGIASPEIRFVWGLAIIASIILAAFLWRRKLLDFSRTAPQRLESAFIQSGRTVPAWVARLANYQRSSEIRKAYLRVATFFNLLDVQFNPADTPRSRHLAWCRAFPEIEEYSNLLLDDYERDQYSAQTITDTRARRVSRQMIVAIIRERIYRLFQRK